MNGEAPRTKLCIACGCEIPASASLCSECSSFQAGWKNSVRFTANVVGIASVAIAVITYVVATFPQLRRAVAWSESIRVLGFDQALYAFANEGDGEVFLSHISIRLGSGETFDQLIQKTILPGSVLTGETELAKLPDVMEGEVVSHTFGKEWTDLYQAATPVDQAGCIHWRILAKGDPFFKMLSGFLRDDLNTFVAEANVHYYSPHERSMRSTTFDAVGVLQRSANPKCTPK